MSRVSHFQRFSQPENHATNNTLLLFRHLYQVSPFKMQLVLTSLLETEVSIGLVFDQQIKGSASVPDALIAQEPLRIFIETKRGASIDVDQIRRHFASIAQLTKGVIEGDCNWLIGLTKEPIPDSIRTVLNSDGRKSGINFAAATFSQVVEAVRGVCFDWERELISILEDYEEYLAEEELLEERNQYLVVVPCGTSLVENVRFGLYYEPVSRPCKHSYSFLGLYSKKTVAYVGAIQAIASARWTKEGVEFSEERGNLSDDHRKRIADAMEETPYYDLKAGAHRFYLVDSFVPTSANKTSPGGIMGLRYLDLTKLISTFDARGSHATTELAELLKTATWE